MIDVKNIQNHKIAVIVPIYNMEQYLSKTLDSVIGQTFKNLEIICVNDGSTDSSGSIIQQYAGKDNRIITINKDNGGLSSARNAGIKAAASDFILFVDSDDWIEPETCEILLNHMIEQNVDLVAFKFKRVYDNFIHRKESDEYYDNKFSWPAGKYPVNDDLISSFFVFAWAKLYKKSIIDQNKIEFPENLIFEDWVFYWKYITASKSIYSINDILYNYRQREDSIMASIYESDGAEKQIIDYLKTAEIVYEYLIDNNLFNDYIKSFCAYYLLIYENAHYFIKEEYKSLVKSRASEFLTKIQLQNYKINIGVEQYDSLAKIISES